MFDRLRSPAARPGKNPAPRVIRVVEGGVTLLDGDRPCWRFAWGEVREVVAFKRDLITTDLVCLDFKVAGGWVVVHEEFEGWSDLIEMMGRHLPIDPPDWFPTVIHPAFAPNVRVLFRRE